MATISSPGIGSGLDVKNIVSQLVALEKQPLTALKADASTVQAKISAFGQIKSLVSTLSDAAYQLSSVTGWNAVAATSSNPSGVTASAVGGTLPTVFSVSVSALAKAQSTTTAALSPVSAAVGAGTLTITPNTGAAIAIDITDSDKLSDVASKINGSAANVTATILTDATGEHLLLRSKNTGVANGYSLSAVEAPSTGTGLSRLATGSTTTQAATDAAAMVNGVAVTSSTNVFANTVTGVTFTALQVTTTPVDIAIAKDPSTIKTNIDNFVKAYNAVNQLLNEATKYDTTSKTGALLQGDSSALTLQNGLRSAAQSITTGSAMFHRLADVGITQQRGGDLVVDSSKLALGISNVDELKKLFSNMGGGGAADGISVKVKTLANNLLASGGYFSSKDTSLNRALARNAQNQAQVNDRAARVEASLTARYSALDAKMSSLNALNAYVAQQVTTWNRNSA